MIFQKIPYSLISLKGLIALATRVIETISKRHEENSFLSTNLERLKSVIEEAARAVGSKRGLDGTQAVIQADEYRDDSYDSLKFYLRAGMR